MIRWMGILSILAVLLACRESSEPRPPARQELTPAARRVLTLGDIEPDDPVKAHEALKPLADHLERELEGSGLDGVRIRIAPDMATMSEWMIAGEVDLYFDSPYPALIVGDRSRARIVLRRWKGGISSYHSVVFTRRDSGVGELMELEGKKIAFDDPASTSGFLLPAAILLDAGLELVYGETETGSQQSLRYLYAGEDTAVVEWVLAGRAQAGAVDNLTYDEIPAATRKSLRVVARSKPVPRHFVLVGPTVDEELEESIVTELLDLESSTAGRLALESLRTTRFDLPEQGLDEILNEIRRFHQLTKNLP